jgi:hypothetical protein
MRAPCIAAILFFAACDTASPGYMGIEAQTVTVGQSTFDVRRKENEVELVRTNAEFAPSLRSVIPRAARAVTQVTGCTPVNGTWTGDAALMRVAISCEN